MRILLTLLFLVLTVAPVAAQQAERPVPDLVFSQKVNIVVTAKKDPRIFDVKIEQEKDKITIAAIVDQNVEREQAREIATHLVMLAKSMSLDDPPKDKKQPGKGLYQYDVSIARPDGVTLMTAKKKSKKEKLSFEDRPDLQPLTRAGASGR